MIDFDDVPEIKEEEKPEIYTGLTERPPTVVVRDKKREDKPKRAFPTQILSTVCIIAAIVVMGLYVKGSVNSNVDSNANVLALGINNVDSNVTAIGDGIASLQEKTDNILANQDNQDTAIGELSKKVDKIKIVVPAAKPKLTQSQYNNYKKCVESVTALKYTGETLDMAMTQCKAWLK
jgi:hypothetical protein